VAHLARIDGVSGARSESTRRGIERRGFRERAAASQNEDADGEREIDFDLHDASAAPSGTIPVSQRSARCVPRAGANPSLNSNLDSRGADGLRCALLLARWDAEGWVLLVTQRDHQHPGPLDQELTVRRAG
jgi:hypothetical protein